MSDKREFFMWVCPSCGLHNFEVIEKDEYLCRAGDCGEVFKPEDIEMTDYEFHSLKFS